MSWRFVRPLARLGIPLLALGAALGVGGTAVASSSVVIGPGLIGPDQYFVGLVNGKSADATISVDCYGPPRIGGTGHPTAGQSVSASRVGAITPAGRVGFTGDAGDSIVVGIIPGPTVGAASTQSVQLVGTLYTYGTELGLSASLVLPCSGTGTVVFAPAPSSLDSRAFPMNVTFVPVWCPPTWQVCPLDSES